MANRTIAVIGSLNVDFITRTPRLPAAGETLTANSFDTGFGGKGANQAVACARLAHDGVKVQMVGNVGDDSFGVDYVAALEREGVIASRVTKLEGQKTGIANIIVEDSTGENRIMLATNANHAFPAEKDASWDMVSDGMAVVVFQLEIPMGVVSLIDALCYAAYTLTRTAGLAQYARSQSERPAHPREPSTRSTAAGLCLPRH